MAEFLIRIVDKININSKEKNSKCLKRGDVVVIREDEWSWSQAEKTNPEWVIRKFPGTPASAFSGYLAPEPGDSLLDKFLQPRFFKFDLDIILNSDSTEDSILTAKITKHMWSDRV